MNTSLATGNIATALIEAQAEIANPTKNKTARIPTKSGGSYTYTYADLGDVLDAVKPVLNRHGLCVVQEAATDIPGMVGVTTRILHTSGEWIEYAALEMPSGSDAQSVGSAVTYARRYSLTAALGISADEDDDGASTKAPAAKRASSGNGEAATSPAPDASSAGLGEPADRGSGDVKPTEHGDDSPGDAPEPTVSSDGDGVADPSSSEETRTELLAAAKAAHGTLGKALKIARDRYGASVNSIADLSDEQLREMAGVPV
jgi:hypothetical protein